MRLWHIDLLSKLPQKQIYEHNDNYMQECLDILKIKGITIDF